jgi:hypothetical protein
MMILKDKECHCVGCGSAADWDGQSPLTFVCTCGARVIADEEGNVTYPSILINAISTKKNIRHIDYYLGKSNYVSLEKQKIYEVLVELGAKWSWKCKRCRRRVINRTRFAVERGMLRYELHPELKALL